MFSWEESLSTCSSRPYTTSPPQAGTMEMCECSELVWGKVTFWNFLFELVFMYILKTTCNSGCTTSLSTTRPSALAILSHPMRQLWGVGDISNINLDQECCVHNFENLNPASTNDTGSILKNLLVKIPAAILLATIFLRTLPVIS